VDVQTKKCFIWFMVARFQLAYLTIDVTTRAMPEQPDLDFRKGKMRWKNSLLLAVQYPRYTGTKSC